MLEELFDTPHPVIAMLHTGPSPGVPAFVSVKSEVERALIEAEVYAEQGVDALMIENMHDFPCVHERNQGPEIAAFMTRVVAAVKDEFPELPLGVQVLFQANCTAVAVAQAAGAQFVRAEGWTHAHVSDKGIADADAGRVLRYRHAIEADDLYVLADIRKKHAAHAWTADLDMADLASMMSLHQADGVIVTGSATATAPDMDDLRAVREVTSLPLFVGSGMTGENIAEYAELADAFIIGSAFKEGGRWDAPVCTTRVREIMKSVRNGK
jgi:membrane complex biogenesis BtpA family protein